MKIQHKKAIEGGFPEARVLAVEGTDFEKILYLEPEYFQALGKAKGKESGIPFGFIEWTGSPYHPDSPAYERKRYTWWLYHQHRLIDHLAEGKDIESFFESI